MMIYSLFSGISDDISNYFRGFMWQFIYTMIKFINALLNALCKGVITFPIINNQWVSAGYKACIALMFCILPAKIIWELVYAVLTDADSIDPMKKIFGGIVCCMIAISLQYVIPMVNNISVNASTTLFTMEYGSTGSKKTMSTENKDFSKNLVISILSSFGGMDKSNKTFSYVTNGSGQSMDLGAERFYDYIINPDNALKGYEGEPSQAKQRTDNSFFSKGMYNRWSFYYRWDTNGSSHFGGTDGSDDFDLLGSYENDKDFPESVEQGASEAYGDRSVPKSKAQAQKAYNYICSHSGDYIWDFGYLGTIIGLIIFLILIIYISIEIAMRIIMIGFWYIIGPLCCLSLTNQQNPQAFNVWKNAIIGAYVVNFSQLFILQFLMNISGDIVNTGSNVSIIAGIVLYFGAFSAVISAPPFVQSMIGGYGSGFLESMNQMKGIWGSTGGMVSAGVKKVTGRHNDMTGHLTGGIRGHIVGNYSTNGQRVGGAVNRIKSGTKSLANGVLGKKDTNQFTLDKDGKKIANPNYGNRSGGLMGELMGEKSNANDGRMGRVPITQRAKEKIQDTAHRGVRNFTYAPNSSRGHSSTSSQRKTTATGTTTRMNTSTTSSSQHTTRPSSKPINSMNNLFNSTNKNNEGGKQK